MSNINRSFSVSNEDLIRYLDEGDFEGNINDLLFYEDARNVDVDLLFALVRRMEFILPQYEDILAGCIVEHDLPPMDINQVIYGITDILRPDLVRILCGSRQKLSPTSQEYARLMLRGILVNSHELRMLVVCWLMDRVSVKSAVGETDYLIVVPTRVVS